MYNTHNVAHQVLCVFYNKSDPLFKTPEPCDNESFNEHWVSNKLSNSYTNCQQFFYIGSDVSEGMWALSTLHRPATCQIRTWTGHDISPRAVIEPSAFVRVESCQMTIPSRLAGSETDKVQQRRITWQLPLTANDRMQLHTMEIREELHTHRRDDCLVTTCYIALLKDITSSSKHFCHIYNRWNIAQANLAPVFCHQPVTAVCSSVTHAHLPRWRHSYQGGPEALHSILRWTGALGHCLKAFVMYPMC